jgi:hypothetical protein
MERERDYTLADHETEAAKETAAERAKSRNEMRAAAGALVQALRNKDVMGVNVSAAQKRVNEATAAVDCSGELARLASALATASHSRDLASAESVRDELGASVD